jgi:hypothetical protein
MIKLCTYVLLMSYDNEAIYGELLEPNVKYFPN